MDGLHQDDATAKALLLYLSMFLPSMSFAGEIPWAVYYGADAATQDLLHYRMLVLESEAHPSLLPLLEKNVAVLAYLSLGEVVKHRSYFDKLKEDGLLIQENKNWADSHVIDIRDPRWSMLIIHDLIPYLLQQGFDGVFLDTLDSSLELERTQPRRYPGMKQAALRLVQQIRLHYPTIKIMVNRAYELLPQLGKDIDMVLGESVYATYDFSSKTYRLVDAAGYRYQLNLLTSLKQKFPHLQIMTLDYWNPDDPAGMAKIYAQQRRNGFSPYVATISLNQIILEPKL